MSCHLAHFACFCLISEHGFIGYSPELLQNNTLPDYSPGESFFTVFGVFFPTATGTGILFHYHVRDISKCLVPKMQYHNGPACAFRVYI